jgi:hypothetical protein
MANFSGRWAKMDGEPHKPTDRNGEEHKSNDQMPEAEDSHMNFE